MPIIIAEFTTYTNNPLLNLMFEIIYYVFKK
jgi:hypothetical protein